MGRYSYTILVRASRLLETRISRLLVGLGRRSGYGPVHNAARVHFAADDALGPRRRRTRREASQQEARRRGFGCRKRRGTGNRRADLLEPRRAFERCAARCALLGVPAWKPLSNHVSASVF